MFLEAQTFALLAFSLIYRGYCVTFLSVDASKPKNRFDKSKSCRPRINREAPSIWQSFNSFFKTFRKELKKNFQKIIFCIPSEKTKVPTVLWGKSGTLTYIHFFSCCNSAPCKRLQMWKNTKYETEFNLSMFF